MLTAARFPSNAILCVSRIALFRNVMSRLECIVEPALKTQISALVPSPAKCVNAKYRVIPRRPQRQQHSSGTATTTSSKCCTIVIFSITSSPFDVGSGSGRHATLFSYLSAARLTEMMALPISRGANPPRKPGLTKPVLRMSEDRLRSGPLRYRA